MDKTERAKLIRERAKALGGAIPVPKGKPRKKGYDFLTKYWPGFVIRSVGQHRKELPARWVFEPDERPDPFALKTRRTASKSALRRIAERWDERKLLPRMGRV